MQQLEHLDNLIIEALADMNKAPANMDQSQLDQVMNDWAQYSELVSWAAKELQCVAHTEESVDPVKSEEDLPNFNMEYSGLLKELGCPYTIMEQSVGCRFDTNPKRKLLLNFVLSELQAARISYVHDTKPKQLKVELDESPTAKLLREISMELALGKPPDTITVGSLWSNISNKIGGLLKSTGTLDPLFEGVLSPNQWSQIEQYNEELTADYEKRREMLLKRLDVTIQSFHWSERMKGPKEKEINDKFRKHRSDLTSVPAVKVSDVLAARIDLPIVEKTASASVRKNTKSAVNNVVIGRVPDRGGRTDEIQPPPPEMPPWQQRQGGAPPGTSGWIQGGQPRGGGGGGRGGGGRGGGGRVQGGWSDSGQRGGGGGGRQQNNYSNQQQQYDNRGGGGGYSDQRQYDNRGGSNNQYQQQQYDNRGGGGGYYQQQNYNNTGDGENYDNRSGGDYYQQQGRNYNDQNQGGGRRDNRYDDNRDHYRGGRGGRGGGRRY